uniref:Secreted protein n=1 Tax=Meloidogyne hapla TaxID=6305 RepID=A0A1I8BKW8_MELHA
MDLSGFSLIILHFCFLSIGLAKLENASNGGGVYESVQIDDPAENGVDYLADLASKGLPKIMNRLALPTIRESGLVISDAVITKMDEPHIGVTNCTVDPGSFVMKFYGPEASEFYAIVDLIRDGIDSAIRDKICTLPPLMREFIYQKIHLITSPQPLSNETFHGLDNDFTVVNNIDEPSAIFNQLCSSPSDGRRRSNLMQSASAKQEKYQSKSTVSSEDEQSLEVDIAEMNFPSLIPDLTLRYPPKFSQRDLIFGIDGGFLNNGNRAPAFMLRPKFSDIKVRDQVSVS